MSAGSIGNATSPSVSPANAQASRPPADPSVNSDAARSDRLRQSAAPLLPTPANSPRGKTMDFIA